jgi:hypothetical protein
MRLLQRLIRLGSASPSCRVAPQIPLSSIRKSRKVIVIGPFEGDNGQAPPPYTSKAAPSISRRLAELKLCWSQERGRNRHPSIHYSSDELLPRPATILRTRVSPTPHQYKTRTKTAQHVTSHALPRSREVLTKPSSQLLFRAQGSSLKQRPQARTTTRPGGVTSYVHGANRDIVSAIAISRGPFLEVGPFLHSSEGMGRMGWG